MFILFKQCHSCQIMTEVLNYVTCQTYQSNVVQQVQHSVKCFCNRQKKREVQISFFNTGLSSIQVLEMQLLLHHFFPIFTARRNPKCGVFHLKLTHTKECYEENSTKLEIFAHLQQLY